MHIVGDVLLFIATSVALSITILCVAIQIQARDPHSRSFLYILGPLTIHLGIATLSSYLSRILPPEQASAGLLSSASLLMAITSIVLITVILFSVSAYIIQIAKENIEKPNRIISSRALVPFAVVFLLLSLFAVFYVTRGNWDDAVSLTLKYYSSWGILFLLPHVVAAAILLPRAKNRDGQNHLRGIIYTFAPIAVLVPLDIIFFSDHFFKLSYLSFAAFSAVVYFHISKEFVRDYHLSPELERTGSISMAGLGLSPREEETARLLIKGRTNAEIAEELYISENTVRSHIKAIYRKLDVSNRVQLIHKIRYSDE